MHSLTPHKYSITAILVSRFLLALQEADRTVVRLDPDDSLHTSRDPYNGTPSFISSLGAFINPDLLTPSDDDVEMEVVGLDREDGREGGAQTCETEAAASSSSA